MLRLSARRAAPAPSGLTVMHRSPHLGARPPPPPLLDAEGASVGRLDGLEGFRNCGWCGWSGAQGRRESRGVAGNSCGRKGQELPGHLLGDLGDICPVLAGEDLPSVAALTSDTQKGNEARGKGGSCGHKPPFPPRRSSLLAMSSRFPRGCEDAGRGGVGSPWALVSGGTFAAAASEGGPAEAWALTGGRQGTDQRRRTFRCPSLVPRCPHTQASVIKMPGTFALCSTHSVCDFFPFTDCKGSRRTLSSRSPVPSLGGTAYCPRLE